MPKKYNIQTKSMPPRFTPVGKSTILDWGGGCLRCFKCVKRRCIYDVYNERTFDTSQLTDTIDNICRSCLRCVQSCPGRVITKIINPEYTAMGDSYWTPDIIASQWKQAETGSIPVSGTGYGGPFTGPGFDDMWTDMSEIIRPTRDGIHGREYINTSVSLGRKLISFRFDDDENPILDRPVNIEIPIPLIFTQLPFGSLSQDVYLAMIKAAKKLNTLITIPSKAWGTYLEPYAESIIPVLSSKSVEDYRHLCKNARIVEIDDTDGFGETLNYIKKEFPDLIVMIKSALDENSSRRIEALANTGAEIIHVYADRNGKGFGERKSWFIKDILREVHTYLVDRGIRDSVTLVASGGIAMAEHVAKTIICGADAVEIDIPILLALECRICLRCENGLSCPVQIENIHPEWGSARIINQMGAWRNQILEILGAMGIREVKRLRGETGRAMFFKDLESETFGKIFNTHG